MQLKPLASHPSIIGKGPPLDSGSFSAQHAILSPPPYFALAVSVLLICWSVTYDYVLPYFVQLISFARMSLT